MGDSERVTLGCNTERVTYNHSTRESRNLICHLIAGYTKTTTTTPTPMTPAVDKVVAGESRSLSTGAIIGE